MKNVFCMSFCQIVRTKHYPLLVILGTYHMANYGEVLFSPLSIVLNVNF